jgi:phage protein D
MSDPKLLSQFYVKIDGADASEEFMRALVEATVESSLHMPDVATFVLHDPHLQWVDDALVGPGKTVEVSARSTARESQGQAVFQGEIVEIEPEFGVSTQRLIVRAFDRLHRLSRGRRVRSFQNVTDSDLVQRLAKEAGLQAEVESTSQVHQYVFQNNETNLEFLSNRAKLSGYLLYVEGTKLCFKALAKNGQPVQLRWGTTLTEFRPRLSTMAQVDTVTARGWDPSTRSEIVGQATQSKGTSEIGQDTHGGEVAKSAFNLEAAHLISNQPIRTQAGADHLAKVAAERQAERFVQAEGTCRGNPELVAGVSVKIDAVGTRFSGTYFVTAATHIYNVKEGYNTQFAISGQTSSTLLALLRTDRESQASGLGLVIGIVTDNQDPKGWGRVKVKYPWLSSDHASDWARVVATGAGAQRGIEFLPEVNDEVVVGFEMGDVHHPFVLGGLWNGQDAPPKKSGEVISGGHVQQRIIRSRGGHTITLDDNDRSSSIAIEDKSGNKIVLNSRENKLLIEVKGDTTLTTQGNLSLKAQGQVQIQGTGIQIDGGPATVDVKGTLINLN